jgi:uncharacterized membrane protein
MSLTLKLNKFFSALLIPSGTVYVFTGILLGIAYVVGGHHGFWSIYISYEYMYCCAFLVVLNAFITETFYSAQERRRSDVSTRNGIVTDRFFKFKINSKLPKKKRLLGYCYALFNSIFSIMLGTLIGGGLLLAILER